MTDIGASSSPDEFAVALSWEDSILLVRPSGELDLATGGRLVDAVDSALAFRELSGHRVEVDLAGLSFVDVCGYSSLLEIRRLTIDRGVPLEWHRPRMQLVRLLELIGATGGDVPIELRS